MSGEQRKTRYLLVLDIATNTGFREIVEIQTMNKEYAQREYDRALRWYSDTNDVLVRLEKVMEGE